MAYATIDAHRRFSFKVDPYDISWGFKMRTQSTDTYGGKVVQILGIELTTLSINTVAGGAGYPYVQEMVDFFREMGLWQQREQQPATFIFPPKGYNLKFWGQRFNVENSLNNVVYPISITGTIQSDIAGTLTKSIMTAELAKLAEGIGYVRNIYNDPDVGQKNQDQRTALNASAAASGTPVTGAPVTGAGSTSSGPIPVVINGVNVTIPSGNPHTVYGGHDFAGTVIVAPTAGVAAGIAAGMAYLGWQYAWGGGDINGPHLGIRDGGQGDANGDYARSSFDCSGLTCYIAGKYPASIPRSSSDQRSGGQSIPWDQALPGDLVGYGGHITCYLGTIGGQRMQLESPESGGFIQVSAVRSGADSTVHRWWS